MKDEEVTQMILPEIQDSFGLIGESFLEANWHFFAIGALAFIVLALILYYIFKPRQRQISPYEKAMASIENLNATELESKLYLSGLIDIIKTFIQARYEVKALGLTSLEFTKELENLEQIDEELKEKVSKLLELADLVKFTGQSIQTEQREGALAIALEVLEKSKAKKEGK